MEDETDGLVPSRPSSAEPGKSRPSTPTTQKKANQSLVDLAIRGKAKPTNKERVRGEPPMCCEQSGLGLMAVLPGGYRWRCSTGRLPRYWRYSSSWTPHGTRTARSRRSSSRSGQPCSTSSRHASRTHAGYAPARDSDRDIATSAPVRIRRRSCTSATTALCGSMGK